MPGQLLAARRQLDLQAAVERLDLAFAPAQLGQQARVLDGDRRLLGEVQHQADRRRCRTPPCAGGGRRRSSPRPPLHVQRNGEHRAQVQIGDRHRLPEASVAGGVDGDDRLAARRGPARDRARQLELRRLERPLIDVARDLDHQLAALVLEQQEAALGVGQLDHRVDDHLEQPRQAQLAVESLVDAQQAPEPPLGLRGARRQRRLRHRPLPRAAGEPARLRIALETRTKRLRCRHADLLEDAGRERQRLGAPRAIPFPLPET